MPNEKGRIHLEPVRLSVGMTRDRRGSYERLACYDPEMGKELGNYTAVMQALAEAEAEARAAKQQVRAAKQQVRAEAQARAEAEARVRALGAELKRSCGAGP